MSTFYDDWLRGGSIKELVKGLLEKSGYMVCPYGYESTFSQVKKLLWDKGAKNSPTTRRLRASPDILVYDDLRKDVMLVEIKMRGAKDPSHVAYLQLERYFEFWSDTILALAIPSGSVLYAQRVSDLEKKNIYDADSDFERFEDIFSRVTKETIDYFKPRALKAMEKKR